MATGYEEGLEARGTQVKQTTPLPTPLDRATVITRWRERMSRGELAMADLIITLNRKAGTDPQRLRAAAAVLAEVQRPPT